MTNSGVNGNKIVMGIPSLGLYHKEFITSLMTVSLGQVLENYCIMEGALLPQSRNMILRLIYQHDPDFTHVLFCDDDMCNFNAKTILDLIEADKDVISALCTFRQPPYNIVGHFPGSLEEIIEIVNAGEPYKVEHVGMGFTLIKEHVLDKIMEQTEDGPLWFNCDRYPRITFQEEMDEFIETKIDRLITVNGKQDKHFKVSLKRFTEEAIAFGATSHKGSKFLGEDICFSKEVTKQGFEMWIHCGCSIGHIGKQVADVQKNIADKRAIVV